jgi:uncharacterized membrane protein YkvI
MSESGNSLEKKALKGTMVAGFGVASVWFGTHVGAGFATGNQELQYYSNYGWTGAIYPLLSMALLGYIMFVIMKFCRMRSIDNYKDAFTELWQPYPKLELSFEVFYIIILLAGVGAVLSGAALMVVNYLSVPYFIAVCFVTVLLVLLCIFGVKLIIAVSSFLSIGIILTAGCIIVMGILNRPDEVAAAFSKPLSEPVYAAWRGILVYAGFQCAEVPPVIAASAILNQKGIKKAAILGWFMNGGLLALSCLMLLGWREAIVQAGETALPNFFICKTLGFNWLSAIYSMLLFFAFISTGVTLTYTMIQRFYGKLFPKTIPDIRIRKALVGIIVILVCLAISFMGLSNIVRYAYAFTGYIGLVAVILPVIIIGNIKNKRYAAAVQPEVQES